MITLLLVIPLIGCLCLIPFKEIDTRDLAPLRSLHTVGYPEDSAAGRPKVNTGTVIASAVIDLENNNKNKLRMKQIALFTSLLNLLVAIVL